MAFGVETAAVLCINVGSDVLRRYKWDLLILTHGLELADQLLLGPLGPLLLVRVDGAQDRPTWFPTILDGRNIQIVDEHDVRVLRGGDRAEGRAQIRVFSEGHAVKKKRDTDRLLVPKIEPNEKFWTEDADNKRRDQTPTFTSQSSVRKQNKPGIRDRLTHYVSVCTSECVLVCVRSMMRRVCVCVFDNCSVCSCNTPF